MLKRFGRRFYSAKYVYSIHLHGVSPWFMHDKPAKITWKRGSKKHKKGETQAHVPVHTRGKHRSSGTLQVEETFELGVTLYAESNRTRKTGPYGQKELKLVIMEVDDEGEVYSILGALSINLNEYVGLIDHKVRVPIECDKEIIDAIGQPYLDLSVRSWYRQSTGATSASSGISSTGWTVDGGSDSDGEEHNELTATGDLRLDPVKPLDVMDPRKSTSSYTMDSVPERIEADGTVPQDQQGSATVTGEATVPVNRKAAADDAAKGISISPPVAVYEADTSLSTKETETLSAKESEKNNVHEEDEDDAEEAETPPAMAVAEIVTESASGAPTEAGLLTPGIRYKRLSTINSEAGEEAMELVDDDLRKFLESEAPGNEIGLENIPLSAALVTEETDEVVGTASATTKEGPKSSLTSEQTAAGNKAIVVPATSQQGKPIETRTGVSEVTPLPVSSSAVQGTKNNEHVTAAKQKAQATEPKPIQQKPQQPRPSGRPVQRPVRSRTSCWTCLPGGRLVCCQPALPREP